MKRAAGNLLKTNSIYKVQNRPASSARQAHFTLLAHFGQPTHLARPAHLGWPAHLAGINLLTTSSVALNLFTMSLAALNILTTSSKVKLRSSGGHFYLWSMTADFFSAATFLPCFGICCHLIDKQGVLGHWVPPGVSHDDFGKMTI